jgi:hypothetical protein
MWAFTAEINGLTAADVKLIDRTHPAAEAAPGEPDSGFVVIDRDAYRSADTPLDSCPGSAVAREVVYDEFVE